MKDILWLDKDNTLFVDNDLAEYLAEMSFKSEGPIDEAEFIEFWELLLLWQKEVQE